MESIQASCSVSNKFTVNNSVYYSQTANHCCVCQGEMGSACCHTGGPHYCSRHDPQQWQWQKTWDDVNTGGQPWKWIPNSGTPLPFPQAPFTITLPEPKCYICKENLQLDELLENDKVCRECRRAIEAFKTILVHEEEEK